MLWRDDRGHQSELLGLFNRDRLARHRQLGRLAQAEHPGQEEEAPGIGDESDANEGHDQLRACRGDPQIACQSQAEPGSGSRPVERRDHRLGAAANRTGQRRVVLAQVITHAGVARVEAGADILQIRAR